MRIWRVIPHIPPTNLILLIQSIPIAAKIYQNIALRIIHIAIQPKYFLLVTAHVQYITYNMHAFVFCHVLFWLYHELCVVSCDFLHIYFRVASLALGQICPSASEGTLKWMGNTLSWKLCSVPDHCKTHKTWTVCLFHGPCYSHPIHVAVYGRGGGLYNAIIGHMGQKFTCGIRYDLNMRTLDVINDWRLEWSNHN